MYTNTPQQAQNNTSGSTNRPRMDICWKHVWITSKVPAHALAKHFSPINRAACKSVDAPPAHTPTPNSWFTPHLLTAKHYGEETRLKSQSSREKYHHSLSIRRTKKNNNKKFHFEAKLWLRPHLEFSGCDEKCGRFTSIFRRTNYFPVFTEIASATEELYTTTK